MAVKRELAIVLGVTGDWTFAVANVLMGIKSHSPQIIDTTDFIILHQGMNNENKRLLNSITPCSIREYHFPSDKLKELHPENYSRFSEMTYSRYECFKLLDEYKKVVWLDVDIVVQNDIAGMFDYADRTGIAFCKAGNSLKGHFIKEWDRLKKYDLKKTHVNAGIFVISDKLKDYKQIADWCYEKTIELCDILFLVDQSILNLMFQEFNLEVEMMDKKYNCSYPKFKKESKKAYIIHTCDYRKTWNYWSFKEWNRNNIIWIKMGGTPFQGKKINPVKEYLYKKIYCRLFHDKPDPIRHPKKFIKKCFNLK